MSRHLGQLTPYRAAAEQYQERFPAAAHRFATHRRRITAPNGKPYCRHLATQADYVLAG